MSVGPSIKRREKEEEEREEEKEEIEEKEEEIEEKEEEEDKEEEEKKKKKKRKAHIAMKVNKTRQDKKREGNINDQNSIVKRTVDCSSWIQEQRIKRRGEQCCQRGQIIVYSVA